ncbi:hypothetical protein ACMA1D_10620 [Streptomyces sp. 796.1]|uniref:hypothetical protein n=1 Tax=Streptomyces sp. 796.1 TaxID=3163029 RepID=UPI0039C90A72
MQDESREVIDRLARIETKLDAAIFRSDDHEARIRRVERWFYALPVSAVASVAAAATALWGR